MNIGAIVFAIGSGLAVNECCDVAPWCARKLVRWSAYRRYPDSARAEARAEELEAVINDRPGKLFKLITALAFVGGAALVATRRVLGHRLESVSAFRKASTAAHPAHDEIPCSEVLERLYSYLDENLPAADYAKIRQHLDQCGPCLREYGLEEVVKQLVHRSGYNGTPQVLRAKVMARIQELRIELP